MTQPLVQLLEWDSEFLGFDVGRLAAQQLSAANLATLMDQSRAVGYRLLYLIADPADATTAAAASHASAWLADRRVTFAREINVPLSIGTATAAGSSAVFNATEVTPQLEQLAWQSGEFSRFRRDAQFAPRVFIDLYRQWLQASFTGELAQVVLAYLLPSTRDETGLLTLGQKAGVAHIGLLAVARAARRQGIGQQLVEAAWEQALRWNCSRMQVVTQRDNVPACRFYQQCGFELVQEEHIYHLWL